MKSHQLLSFLIIIALTVMLSHPLYNYYYRKIQTGDSQCCFSFIITKRFANKISPIITNILLFGIIIKIKRCGGNKLIRNAQRPLDFRSKYFKVKTCPLEVGSGKDVFLKSAVFCVNSVRIWNLTFNRSSGMMS